jgi:hypothetical protein
MIKCYAPWTNLDVGFRGKLQPCCKFKTQFYQDSDYNLIDGDVENYLNSPMLNTVKKELLSGIWPEGCLKCKNDESVNAVSRRQRDLIDFEYINKLVDFSEPSNIKSVSVDLGISCNLACIICDHTKSTGWRPETKKIYNITPASLEHTISKKKVEAIAQLPPHHLLELEGGEPLTTNLKDHKLLLDHYISTGHSKNMMLRYHTNGTVWPSQDLWARWKHFQQVDLKLSIDGIGSVFEYTRWPGRWSDFESNAAKYCALRDSGQNIVVSAQITVSAYNCMSLDEIYSWCNQYNITDIFLSKVLYPDQLQLNAWPEDAKEVISKHMCSSSNQDVVDMGKWLETAQYSGLFQKFVEFTDTHNNYRHIDISMCSQEIADLYNQRQQWIQQENDIEWQQFYNDIRDPSWPDCESKNDLKNLPDSIQIEIKNLQQGLI